MFVNVSTVLGECMDETSKSALLARSMPSQKS